MIERLVRIETKLDNYENLREKADAAEDKADAPYALALQNTKDISEIKAQLNQETEGGATNV